MPKKGVWLSLFLFFFFFFLFLLFFFFVFAFSPFLTYPGKVTFDRPTTVYQAIMQSGGVSDYGSLSNIHLTRIINGVQRTETINLRPNIRGQPTLPKYVQDGDVIYISRSLF